MSRLGLLFVSSIVVIACGSTTPTRPIIESARPTDEHSTPEPSAPVLEPTPEPTPSAPPATPVPSAPSDLDRIVADEFDDIRMVVELQRNPLPAGRASWVLVTVANEGKDDVQWFHDGCDSRTRRSRPGAGRSVPPVAPA